jgi:hypothetical protein
VPEREQRDHGDDDNQSQIAARDAHGPAACGEVKR